jgi:hypothetical protein
VGTIAGLDVVKKRKILSPYQESNCDALIVKSVT